MKKLPYGMASFEAIREKGEYYYVDKTPYIETLEEFGGRYLFFLRPRRFGKSLFISVLHNYYDINRKDVFDTYFGGTYIHEHPTPLKNSIPILRMNFSVVISYGALEQIEHSFIGNIKHAIDLFFAQYQHLFHFDSALVEGVKSQPTASDMMAEFIAGMRKLNVDYYLLIDEYDNFANNVLVEHGEERYRKITQSGGFLRNFFTVVKGATDSNTIERMFVTGVSPLVLSDVTSGFNIGNNVSTLASLNAMLGLTQAEVDAMLDYYITEGMIPEKEREVIASTLPLNYNHYMFSNNAKEHIYNTDMILYFFGLLTIKRHIYQQNYALHIPNRIVERLHWEYMRDAVSDVYAELKLDVDFLQNEFMNVAFNGHWQKLFDYVLKKFYEAVSIRDFTFHEEGIKLFLLAYLNLTSLYRVFSEREFNGGFCDIYMEKDFVTTDLTNFEYVVELKYVKADDKSLPLETHKKQAIGQLEKYVADHHLAIRHEGQAGAHPTLKKIIIVASATELLALEEAP
ncbi:MAG: hypothetical protein EOM20_14990 [Spartobacteria bacterium]|nr:hypothetical protein [Spartobacteria bacterium]